MTAQHALRILQDYLDDEDFTEHDGEPPLSPHLLWGVFTSYTEHFLCDSTGLVPQVPPGAPRDVTALEALAASRVLADQLHASRWWIAGEARKQGHSWAEIGAALGMSKQAAWEGFRKYTAEPSAPSFRRLYDKYRGLAGDSADS